MRGLPVVDRAFFHATWLPGADLAGAKLTSAELSGAQLTSGAARNAARIDRGSAATSGERLNRCTR
ncbi:pentapeptide repeat-containing protein [Sorangium sp. So ce542]|uniref:pentapeptide repeat-containing protein n=1 Tax=Sorangium sp. So ce542 TaxID=3133316 RepID=UPI003F635A16